MAASRQKHSSSMTDAMTSDEQVHCWCCKALIVVPSVDGVPATVFKVQDTLTDHMLCIVLVAQGLCKAERWRPPCVL